MPIPYWYYSSPILVLTELGPACPTLFVSLITFLSIKLEEVKKTEISGICCSINGLTFVADKGRQCIYRLDLDDGTSFSFGEGKLSKYNWWKVKHYPSLCHCYAQLESCGLLWPSDPTVWLLLKIGRFTYLFLYLSISVNRVWHGKGSQVGNLTLSMSHSSQNISILLPSLKYNCLSIFLVICKASTFYMH